MRFGLWGMGALMLGALAAHFLLQDRGYVLINFRGFIVEMSVPALIFVLVLLYFVMRLLVRIWRAPRELGEAFADRQNRRAGSKLTRGLIHMTEGDWTRGERLLTQGIKGTDAPLVNYLMAARAAQLQGSEERRNEWLKLAYEELPEAETAVLLTQAELQFDNGEYERAVATLKRLSESHPNHPVAIALLAESYRALGDRANLRELLPQLHKARLGKERKTALAAAAFDEATRSAELDAETLGRLWSALGQELRQSPALVRLRALALHRLGQGAQAESELRAALKSAWHEGLVRAYGQIRGADVRKQLKQAESWLKNKPEDGDLLLATARLCIANELWGKARSYLESSLALAPRPDAYALYGQLLTQLGEAEDAASAYRAGLSLVSRVDLDLPVLKAPEPTTSEADDEPAVGS